MPGLVINANMLCRASASFFQKKYHYSKRACSSKGRTVILGRIVSASGQIFRSDFRPQDKIFCPGMSFRPLDEQALSVIVHVLKKQWTIISLHTSQVKNGYEMPMKLYDSRSLFAVGWVQTLDVVTVLCSTQCPA